MQSNFPNMNLPSWFYLYPGMRAIYQNLFSIYTENNPLVISTVKSYINYLICANLDVFFFCTINSGKQNLAISQFQ